MELEKLYNRYKSTSISDIKRYLNVIKIVNIKDNKYYEIDAEIMSKIIKKTRNISFTFEDSELSGTPLKLDIHSKIQFLVKSSSRFFLKPDIGEVFDQLDESVINNISAIYVDKNIYQIVNDECDHFKMEATLLTDKKYMRKSKLNKINKVK